MEIKLKSKKVVKVKEFSVRDEAKVKDIMMKMVKANPNGESFDLINPNENTLDLMLTTLKDSSDKNIRSFNDTDKYDFVFEIQKMLFEGNTKPSK